MPQRVLICRICKEPTAQTTPDVPETCDHCGNPAHCRVLDVWEVTEMDRRFLKSVRIAPD